MSVKAPPQLRMPRSIPSVTLFGRGFWSAANLKLGWSVIWRVTLAEAAVSAALRASLWLARGRLVADRADALLLLAAGTILELLITDAVGRRLAHSRYHVRIDAFIGWAITWRQLLAGLLWLPPALLSAGAGILAIQHRLGEGATSQLCVGVWVAFTAALAATAAVASAGWAVHRALSRMAQLQAVKPDATGGRLGADARTLGEGPEAFLPPIAGTSDG